MNRNSTLDKKSVVIAREAKAFELAYCQDRNQNITQAPPLEWLYNLFEGLFDRHPLDGKLSIIN